MKSLMIALLATAFTFQASATRAEKASAAKSTKATTAKSVKAAKATKASATSTKTTATPAVQRGHAKLGTSFKFDGTALHGKYQNTPSTTATVENDKYLDDLLGARQNFNDRTAKDKERN